MRFSVRLTLKAVRYSITKKNKKEDYLDRQIINKRISSIRLEIEKLNRTLRALENTDVSQYPENYEALSTDAALLGELITCRLRHLIYGTTTVKKSEYLSAAGEIQGIEIKCEDGILEITLPCLIPKRRQRRSTEFLIDPLYFTLSSYVCNHKVPHFKDCVVCFAHVYDESMPSTRIRDYDNLELKQLLDVVSSFVMLDDSGLLCDAYNTTEWGTADCTRMTIMPKERFPKWLEERKNVIKNISDF